MEARPWPWLVLPALAALLTGTAAYMYYDAGRPPGAVGQPESATTGAAREPASNDAPPQKGRRDDPSGGRQKQEQEAAHFEFYTLLPEIEVEITDEDLGAALRALPEQTHKGPYVLQAGSFRRFEEADNLKARLALLGIEAKIQTVTINEESTWYRVRIGPYDTLRDLKPMRSRLRRNDIDFMLMSVAGEG